MPFSTALDWSHSLAFAASSAPFLLAGSPLFVGTNNAVAPCSAIRLANSGWLESLQIAMPNVSSPILKTRMP